VFHLYLLSFYFLFLLFLIYIKAQHTLSGSQTIKTPSEYGEKTPS
jgi:hypothetical protein